MGGTPDETETDAQALADALNDADALWKSVAMNPSDFVVLVDRAGRFRWVNHTAPGIRAEDLLGKGRLFDLMAPEDQPKAREALARCFDLGLPTYFEAYAPQLTTWFSSAVSPVVRAGQTVLASVVTHDISDARRAMRELARRERMLADAQRIAGVGSWHIDTATDAIEWSAEMHRICGVARDVQPTRALFRSIVHPEDRVRVFSVGAPGVARGFLEPHQYRIVRPSDGATRYVQTTGEAVRDEAGTMIGFIGTTLDVTQRVELEADLAQSRKLEALGRLAGGIAHDFNNVMTAIQGNAELAVRSLAAGLPAAENLEAIRAAGERVSSLTRQLLAFARRQIVAPRVVAPNALIESVARLFHPLLGDEVRLELDLQPDAWFIRIDTGQFEQLLMNLAVNARDAMRDAAPGGMLRIETRNVSRPFPAGGAAHPDIASGDYLSLVVTDTGAGIPDELKAHVFEPFFSTKPTGQGTGLGLATCHGIVKQNDGHIWLESAPGVGTRAFVYLPRAVAERAASVPAPAPAPNTGTETVLLVEDEPMVRRVAVRSLKALGYRILEAGTGEAALDLAASHPAPIHLLFCDVMLPGRRGPEIAKALAVSHPETKALFTSGYTEDHAVTTGVDAARVRFLHKPYSLAALATAVRGAIDARPMAP